MKIEKTIKQLQWKILLSGLWLYFLLNIVFRDIHEFLRIGYVEQVLSGVVNGNALSESLLLYAGIALQIPLMMIVASLIAAIPLNRWLNMVAPILMFIGMVAFIENPDMDDILFSVMQAMALVTIVWVAWRGPHVSNRRIRVCDQNHQAV